MAWELASKLTAMLAQQGSREEALVIAAKKNDTSEVRRLLAAGVSVNVTYGCGATPLHVAAARGRAGIARQLVAAGASLEAREKYGRTPLHCAAECGNADCARQLVAAGASLEASDESGRTPLHFAAWGGHADCARQLVAAGASLEARDQCGETPLHLAALAGHAACARQLVAAGASREARDKDGETAADIAAELGFHDLAQQLHAACASLGAADQERPAGAVGTAVPPSRLATAEVRQTTIDSIPGSISQGGKETANHNKIRAIVERPTPEGETTAPRRHLMFSGRFDRSDAEELIRDTHEQMKRRHPSIPTYIVEASAGKAFGRQTMKGCVGMSAMVAFCGSNYGEDTGSTYSTHLELKYAYEHKVPIIPIKLCQEWPPKGGNEAGYEQNHFVFAPDLVYLDLYGKSQDPAAVADHLAKAYYKLSA